ncbi:ERAD-associated E3 ubiquitin-protein ligase HRD1 [Nosema granulosis]|uniref:ERAD-associated E3 ubiquitin-protein ligase HRD1 n=1 Tax=Nosema granulosis TaxID=83296 RepID=A0A9P6KXV2_9MICR|nr:ERAD-associated E3 ubiquitin-protein ligase HRD1 [Nosema granulosis]
MFRNLFNKNNYSYFLFGFFHLSILSFSTFYSTTTTTSTTTFYSLLTKTTEINFLHLLHVSFLIFLLYSFTSFLIYSVLGSLRTQEINLLNDNLFLFLTDILLVLSVFSRDINFRNSLVFFLILCTKAVVWLVTARIEHLTTPGMLYLSYSVSIFSTLPLFFISLSSISILFAFEFALILLASTKNILNIYILDQDDDNRSLYAFYIDIFYLSAVFLFYIIFIVFTSLRFKVPLNVFRSSIVILERLVSKIRLFRKFLKLCEDLENCEDKLNAGDCPICREEMEVGKILRCKHVFHLECLKKWCERQQFCPICKVDLLLSLKEEVIYTEEERILGVPVEMQ